jgi:hypothetical protein
MGRIFEPENKPKQPIKIPVEPVMPSEYDEIENFPAIINMTTKNFETKDCTK